MAETVESLARRSKAFLEQPHTLDIGGVMQLVADMRKALSVASVASGDALRWPIQPEGIGVIIIESLNIPEIATKIAKAIQTGNY